MRDSAGSPCRTLHHYDEIGLLKPSVRSEAGYRLYSAEGLRKLHAIQALRHLGLSLADIGGLLNGQSTAPAMIIEQQLLALDRQIAQATELRERLALIRQSLLQGESPSMNDWLEALGLMGTYGRYFSAAELKIILTRWRLIESKWQELSAEVRAVMTEGAIPTSPEVQPLARRWRCLPESRWRSTFSATTLVCLASYHLLVRFTWVSVLLNGRRCLRSGRPGVLAHNAP